MDKTIIKAYFDTNKPNCEPFVKQVVKILNRQGCNVIQSAVGVDYDYFTVNAEGIKNIYLSKSKELSESDIVVIELSKTSAFMLTLMVESINNKKPTLLLIPEEIATKIDTNFSYQSTNLFYPTYYNDTNLDIAIKTFVENSRANILSTRFTVRFTDNHNKLLEMLKYKWDCSSRNEVIQKLLEKETLGLKL